MMNNFRSRKNEDAVSPVIGAILLIAITVILAAVIASFVFGMAESTGKPNVIGVTATKSGSYTVITYYGGQGSGNLKSLTAVNETDSVVFPSTAIGTSVMMYKPAGLTRTYVVAEFNDGTSQVVFDVTN